MGQARARDSTPGESERALVGLIRVGIPAPAPSALAAAGGVGYGWLDPISGLDAQGHRLAATLSTAVTVLPYLSLAADVRGHLDVFSHSVAESETNLYGEPRLTARFFRQVAERHYWGAEAEVRFVGAEAPSVDWSATSAALRGLWGSQLAEQTWLGAQLGFHLDRSSAVVAHPESVSGSDRRTLGTSAWNALQWGFGASQRLARTRTELIGEVSGEWLVGAGAPSFAEAPGQLSLGARQPFGAALSVLLTAEVGWSARPERWRTGELRPMQPRAAGGLSLLWRFGVPGSPAAASAPSVPRETPPAAAPSVAAPAPVAPPPVAGKVVDEGGRPLPDALVTLLRQGAEPMQTRSAEDGSFRFADVPAGPVELRVSAAGFDDAEQAIAEGREQGAELVLHAAVPAGQVRGHVLDLAGKPIPANLRITPGEPSVEVAADGSFTVELAPGRYTLRLSHPSFVTQERVIVIVDRGVVILNIALTR